MSADKQYSDARQALDLIEREVLAEGQYLTYGRLADLLGKDATKYARHFGQVCSLIDSACYWAKLPMLSLEKIRLNNGDYNPDSFGGHHAPVRNQLIVNAHAHQWTAGDLKRIKNSLTHMNGESALLQWKRIDSFGQTGLDRIESYR